MKIWELEWKKINKKPFLRGIMGLAAFSLSIAMLFLFIPDEEMCTLSDTDLYKMYC